MRRRRPSRCCLSALPPPPLSYAREEKNPSPYLGRSVRQDWNKIQESPSSSQTYSMSLLLHHVWYDSHVLSIFFSHLILIRPGTFGKWCSYRNAGTAVVKEKEIPSVFSSPSSFLSREAFPLRSDHSHFRFLSSLSPRGQQNSLRRCIKSLSNAARATNRSVTLPRLSTLICLWDILHAKKEKYVRPFLSETKRIDCLLTVY